MTDYNLQLAIQSSKRVESTREAMAELVNTMNIMGGDADFAEGIFQGLSQQHRTLQQDFMRAFALAMVKYSEINTDLRNEEAVEYAKKIVAIDSYFPNI